MDMDYELTYNEQLPDNKVERENDKEIATILLQYLSSPQYSSEDKVDLLLELLNRKAYEKDDFRNYSLAILKNTINKSTNELPDNNNSTNYGSANLFGIFREDNSFLIARESSQPTNNRYRTMYKLYDVVSDSIIYKYEFYNKYETLNQLPWRNGSGIEINGINAYIVPITLVIPSKHFEKDGIRFDILKLVNDTINEYLAENPFFVEEVFIKPKRKKLSQSE